MEDTPSSKIASGWYPEVVLPGSIHLYPYPCPCLSVIPLVLGGQVWFQVVIPPLGAMPLWYRKSEPKEVLFLLYLLKKNSKEVDLYRNVKSDGTIPENKDFFTHRVNPTRWYAFGLVMSFIRASPMIIAFSPETSSSVEKFF
jgi:hypothetical protein